MLTHGFLKGVYASGFFRKEKKGRILCQHIIIPLIQVLAFTRGPRTLR